MDNDPDRGTDTDNSIFISVFPFLFHIQFLHFPAKICQISFEKAKKNPTESTAKKLGFGFEWWPRAFPPDTLTLVLINHLPELNYE